VRVPLTPHRGADQGRESGAVAVMAAIGMTFMLVLAAFAVDIGNAYAQGRQLSVSADAASLAAAAKVGDAYRQATCTEGGLASIGADALALQEAQKVVTRNNSASQTSDDITADASCSPDGTAILVEVTTARDVPTGLAGVIGVASSRPNAAATGRWQRSLVGTIRPWAACQDTISDGLADPGKVVAAPLDNKWGICGSSSSGNWGSVDFDGGGNAATDLVNWTRFGYPLMPTVPGPLPADPGISRAQLPTAFRALVNTPILIPVAANYADGANGNNGQFDTTKLALVTVCGAYYQNQAYDSTLSGDPSVCWQNPFGTSTTVSTPFEFPNVAGAVVVTGTNGNNRTATLTLAAATFDPTIPPGDVTVIVPGGRRVGGGQNVRFEDLVTTVRAYDTTSPTTTVTLNDIPDVTTATTFTIRWTTSETVTTPGPAPLESNGRPYNQIQFRVERVYNTSAEASIPCSLDDLLCRGTTTLYR